MKNEKLTLEAQTELSILDIQGSLLDGTHSIVFCILGIFAQSPDHQLSYICNLAKVFSLICIFVHTY
jgi:hypothetical protein